MIYPSDRRLFQLWGWSWGTVFTSHCFLVGARPTITHIYAQCDVERLWTPRAREPVIWTHNGSKSLSSTSAELNHAVPPGWLSWSWSSSSLLGVHSLLSLRWTFPSPLLKILIVLNFAWGGRGCEEESPLILRPAVAEHLWLLFQSNLTPHV